MSEYGGKRTDRLKLPRQVNADPELCLVIRRRAERRRRPVGMQILHLIEVGIEHDPEISANENGVISPAGYAPMHTDAHQVGRRRNGTHGNATEDVA